MEKIVIWWEVEGKSFSPWGKALKERGFLMKKSIEMGF